MKLFILLAIVKRLRVSNTRFNSQKTSKPVHGNKMQKIEITVTSHTYVQYKMGRDGEGIQKGKGWGRYTKGEGMGKVPLVSDKSRLAPMTMPGLHLQAASMETVVC